MALFLLCKGEYTKFTLWRRFVMILKTIFRFVTAGIIGSAIPTAVYFLVV